MQHVLPCTNDSSYQLLIHPPNACTHMYTSFVKIEFEGGNGLHPHVKQSVLFFMLLQAQIHIFIHFLSFFLSL